MDKKLGLYIVLGLVIGAVFGVALGKAIGNTILGIAFGALGGTFVGWFIAAAILKKGEGKICHTKFPEHLGIGRNWQPKSGPCPVLVVELLCRSDSKPETETRSTNDYCKPNL